MKFTRPVFWHEGLFLQPQHFQVLDLFHQERESRILSLLKNYAWGFLELNIRTPALENQVFEFDKVEVIFPDGSYVKVPGNGRIMGRSFERFWDIEGRPLSVYLGLRKWYEDRANVSASSEGASLKGTLPINGQTRYVVDEVPETVADIFSHQSEAQVKFLFYNLEILFEPELEEAGDVELVKVAELIRSEDVVRINKGYVPPLFWANVSERLWGLVKEVRDLLTSRGQEFAEYKKEQLGQVPQFGSQDLLFLLALRSLNRYIPVLHHITESGNFHPFDIYALLRQLVGELSSFSSNYDAFGGSSEDPEVPPYDHQNMWPCFRIARERIVRLLNEITTGPEYVIDLLFDGTYYSADLEERIFKGVNRYYLVLESSLDKKEIISMVEQTAKIGSREQLPFLIARALPGLEARNLPVPPPELPRRPNATYFELDTHSDHWLRIREGLNIGIFFETPLPDLKAQLMVVYERK